MDISSLIQLLKSSDLYAECECGEEFKLSDCIMFDGTKVLPKEVKPHALTMEDQLKEMKEDLDKRIKSATELSKKLAHRVGVGKILEKLAPAHKDFQFAIGDCRALYEPIDLIIFDGVTRNSVKSIAFMEIKTGESRLTKRERSIRDAIEDKKVLYRAV